MKSDPKLDTDDFEAGYKASVLIPGTGETGRLIGWYQYFQMRAGKGWAEQDQPFYSQKLYDDRNSWIKSPTLKDVAMTGVGIAAALMTGGTASGLLPALIAAGQTAGMTIGADALFTAADVAHGADASQSWGEFGKRAVTTGLTSALTAGMNFVPGVADFTKNVGGRMIYAGGIAVANKGISTSIAAINWEAGHIGFDEEAFAQSWDVSNLSNYASVLTAVTGVLGSELTRNVGGDLAEATKWNTKLTGSIGNLAGMMTGQALAYGTSMIATTMQQGNFKQGSWGSALDNMGGINVNLASAGMLLDMVGGAITMNSGNQYNPMELQGLYGAAGKLSNTGLFEMNINSQGTTGRLGQGGVNLGGAMWDVAKHSYGQMNIEAMAKTMTQSDAKQRLTDLYSYGDFAVEGLVNRLGAGIDELAYGHVGANDGTGLAGMGLTTQTTKGRLITLDSQFKDSFGSFGTVALSHEAWRNGKDDGVAGQKQETAAAVSAHTKMTLVLAAQSKDASFIKNNPDLANDVVAYMKAGGDQTFFADYANAYYDSNSDFWRLKAVKDADGKVKGYSVGWDGKLEMTIESADGTTATIPAADIGKQGGLNKLQSWFTANGIDSQWNPNGFTQLGNVSVAAQALMNSVDNKGAGFTSAAKNYKDSVAALLGAGLNLSDLGATPDQSQTYALLKGNVLRTTLYGDRLKIPAIDSIAGDMYFWGTYTHAAEDQTSNDTSITNPLASDVSLRWNDMKGFGMTLDFGDGNSLTNNHLASGSVMNLLQSMLLSNSTASILAGLQVATMGETGSASEGIYNHLEANNGALAPSALFKQLGISQKYTDTDVLLTGLSKNMNYDNPILLAQIQEYSKIHPDFNKQAYVDAHKDLFKPKYGVNGSQFLTSRFDVKTMTWRTTYE